MTRFLILALTSATLAFSPMTAPAAQANDRETARLLAGLAVLGIIGVAIADDKKKKKKKKREQAKVYRDQIEPRYHDTLRNDFERHRDDRHYGKKDRRRALPDDCLHRVETRRGLRHVYGKQCLKRSYRHVSRLPDHCERTVYAYGREHSVYGARCLRRDGWLVAQR